jgi:hypothetical protein
MKHVLLLLCILSKLSALGQSAITNEPRRNPEWDSNTYYVEQGNLCCGYLTLVSLDPLTVAEDPIVGYAFTAKALVNPVSPTLTIDFEGDIPKQLVTVAISDTAGKLQQCDSFMPKENERIISLRRLKNHNTYRIAVYSEDKRVLYWGTFERT